MGRFSFRGTSIEGLVVVDRQCIADNRGFFSRFYCASEFADAGCRLDIAQINHTMTRSRGAVRGLHYQLAPHAETKFVSCLQGEVFDVAVDLRRDSPTFLKWHGEILSEHNRASLLIPEGFAHGFQTLCDDCELVYLHSTSHHPGSESAVHLRDPRVGVEWPLPFTEISSRDERHAFLPPDFKGV